VTASTRRGRKPSQTVRSTIIRLAAMQSWPPLARGVVTAASAWLMSGVAWLHLRGSFNARLGPIFANLILADEINRAPAKVQSALLEAMQERQTTIEGDRFAPRAADARVLFMLRASELVTQARSVLTALPGLQTPNLTGSIAKVLPNQPITHPV